MELLIEELEPEHVLALESSPVISDQTAAKAGDYLFRFERQGFLGDPGSFAFREIELWIDALKSDPSFRGEIGQVYVDLNLLNGSYVVWIPLRLAAGDVLPGLASGFAAVTLVIWLGIMVAAAWAASALAVTVAGDSVRKNVAGFGLLIHPDNEEIAALAKGQIDDSNDNITAISTAVIVVAGVYLLTKTAK